eukprot:291515-Amphidinium_carterae.1
MLPRRQSTNTRSGRYLVNPLPQVRPRQRETKQTTERPATADHGGNSVDHPPSTLEARKGLERIRECDSKSPNQRQKTLQGRPQGQQTTGKKAGPPGNGKNGKQGRPLPNIHGRLGVRRPKPSRRGVSWTAEKALEAREAKALAARLAQAEAQQKDKADRAAATVEGVPGP